MQAVTLVSKPGEGYAHQAQPLPGLTDPDEDCSLTTQIQIFTRSHRS